MTKQVGAYSVFLSIPIVIFLLPSSKKSFFSCLFFRYLWVLLFLSLLGLLGIGLNLVGSLFPREGVTY